MVKLLKTIKQTDEELDHIFQGILIEQLPPAKKEQVCIADAIEAALITFVQDNKGELLAKLHNIKFKKWGIKLELIPQKNIHYYEKTIGKYTGYFPQSDRCQIEAIEITQNIFYEYLEDTMGVDKNFNSAFIKKMLILIDEQVEKKLKLSKATLHLPH